MSQWDPKKVVLSGFVLVSFLLYSVYLRHPDGGARTITPNTSPVSTTSSSTPSSSAASGASSNASTPAPTAQTASKYKDGTYTGSVADAFYGNVQVQVTISGGKITDVKFLQHPNDMPQSQYINSQAMPYLKQEAIQAQSAQVNGVSGASDTSMAFVQSLTAALNKAM